MARDTPRGWPLAVGAAALLAALLLCLPELLMPRLRAFYRTRFPDVAASWPLTGAYTPIGPFDDTDANENAGRSALAARTLIPGDPYVKENRSVRLAWTDTLSFMLMGALIRAFGLSAGWTACRFVGAAGWVLGLYLLLFELCGNRRWSLACACALTLFYDLLVTSWTGHGGLRELVSHLFYYRGSYAYYLGVTRLADPALTLPLCFLGAACAAKAVRRRSAGWGALGGALVGLDVYFHADAYTSCFVGLFFFAALVALARRRLGAELLALCAAMVLVSLPWVALHLPIDADQARRAGLFFGRRVDWLGLLWLSLLPASWLLWREQPAWLLPGCLAAGAGAWTESQLLAGSVVDPINWHRVAVVFFLVFLAAAAGRRLSDKRDWLWAAAALGFWALGRGVCYAALRYPMQGLSADDEAAYAYLNASTPRDSVVAALGPLENLELPIYTRNKVLVGGGYILASDLSTAQLMSRQRRALEVLGIPVERFLQRLAAERPGAGARWDQALWRGRLDWQDREWQLIWNYTHTMSPELYAQGLAAAAPDRSAEVDYVWVGPFERHLMTPAELRRLGRPLFAGGRVALYKAP